MKKLPLFLATAALVFATAAEAHHSFAIFDISKTDTVKGTVKELQWTNPHVWLEVVGTDRAVAPARWSFEGGNVAVMKRSGWSRETMKPGDQVTVTSHPARASGNRGMLVSVTFANGKTLQSMGGSGQAPSAPIIEGRN